MGFERGRWLGTGDARLFPPLKRFIALGLLTVLRTVVKTNLMLQVPTRKVKKSGVTADQRPDRAPTQTENHSRLGFCGTSEETLFNCRGKVPIIVALQCSINLLAFSRWLLFQPLEGLQLASGISCAIQTLIGTPEHKMGFAALWRKFCCPFEMLASLSQFPIAEFDFA